MAATRLAGVELFINYSNSNGTLTEELISWDVDSECPMGKTTPLTERTYMQNLGPSVTKPADADPNDVGFWPPFSQVQLEIRLAAGTTGTKKLSPTSVIQIPARQIIADAPAGTKARVFKMKLKDFIPELAQGKVVELLPGEKRNLFSYSCSSIEYIKLGVPSESSLNMNNNTLLFQIDEDPAL